MQHRAGQKTAYHYFKWKCASCNTGQHSTGADQRAPALHSLFLTQFSAQSGTGITMPSSEELIEAVRPKKVLYDTTHPDYMMLSYKDNIWNETAI